MTEVDFLVQSIRRLGQNFEKIAKRIERVQKKTDFPVLMTWAELNTKLRKKFTRQQVYRWEHEDFPQHISIGGKPYWITGEVTEYVEELFKVPGKRIR